MNQTHATIVVVDDDSDIVEFLCDYLGAMGFNPVPCRVGPQVAACIVQHTPRLVILDLDLGGPGVLTGIEVFHALRGDATAEVVPVIFFTANGHRLQQELPNYRDLGAALVVKPDSVGLRACIQDLVQHDNLIPRGVADSM